MFASTQAKGLPSVRLLCQPETSSEDLSKQADINGFLVSGASLKPAFINIINSHQYKSKRIATLCS